MKLLGTGGKDHCTIRDRFSSFCTGERAKRATKFLLAHSQLDLKHDVKMFHLGMNSLRRASFGQS